MIRKAALAATLISTIAAGQDSAPPAVEQGSGLVPAPSGQVLVLGELHGTREIPAYFLALVRRAARGRGVVVGLELPAEAGQLRCAARGRAALPAYWARPSQDGRTSRAMRDLICALRARSLARRVRIVFLDDPGRRQGFDAPAAERFSAAFTGRPAVGLILTGSYHARNVDGALAFHLRRLGLSVRTVMTSAPAGEAWYCGADRSCGVQQARVNFCSEPGQAAGRTPWTAIPDRRFVWDLCLSFPRLSASPPAAREAP